MSILPLRRIVKCIVTDERLRAFGLPTPGTPGSAGHDLRAMIDEPTLTLQPDQTVLISTGLRIHVEDPTYMGVLYPRSGMGHKRGLVLGNLTGIIDSDYTGPLMVSLWNRGTEPQTIELGDRIAQLVIEPVLNFCLEEVKSFHTETERGDKGFNSTGVK